MITTCIFDAYGTLFDVASAARAVGDKRADFAPHWVRVATTWRLKQLQYTWLRRITDQHKDFWAVTQDGLDFALEESGLDDPDLRAALLALYWELAAYPEVPAMLSTLKDAGYNTGILSNGSPDMLNGAVQSAALGDVLDAVISVEDIKIFKPDMAVYRLVVDRFECTPDQVLFVSSNGWDVAGSAAFGFNTLWVNRAAEPQDRLDNGPRWVASDLMGVPALLEGLK
jgi:2-haloacid dehalogenase